MANNEMIMKVEELKALEALIEEASAEAAAIRDSIKAEMVARNVEEMNIGKFIIRFPCTISEKFGTPAHSC